MKLEVFDDADSVARAAAATIAADARRRSLPVAALPWLSVAATLRGCCWPTARQQNS
jgi:hypothetical protein